MNNSKPENRSPLKFFLLVYGLSIPLWIIETRIDVERLPLLDFSITDILAAFTPLIAAALIKIIGLSLLVISVLVETPKKRAIHSEQ